MYSLISAPMLDSMWVILMLYLVRILWQNLAVGPYTLSTIRTSSPLLVNAINVLIMALIPDEKACELCPFSRLHIAFSKAF